MALASLALNGLPGFIHHVVNVVANPTSQLCAKPHSSELPSRDRAPSRPLPALAYILRENVNSVPLKCDTCIKSSDIELQSR